MTKTFHRGDRAATFPIWGNVNLGLYKTPDEYREAFIKTGRRLGEWADSMLDKISCAEQETEVELVVLSVNELGFNGAHLSDIYRRATELGLGLCPPEIGPALRLAYGNQMRGEWLIVAMEPVTDSTGHPDVFAIVHGDGGLWLYGYSTPKDLWAADYRFLFLNRKQ